MRARGFFRNFHPRQRSLRPRFSSFGTRLTLTRTGQPLGRARLSVTTTDRTPVRHFATNTFQELPAEANIEEELKPGYRQEDFYPVKLGEVFNVRYQVVAKLGCGVGSTAWLCRHLKESCSWTLKVCTANRGSVVASQADTEVSVSQHINSVGTKHPGIGYMRLVIGNFTVKGPHGTHCCLLFDSLGMTLTDLRNLTPERALEKDHLQQSLQLILLSLDLLHQAGVVHTGMFLPISTYPLQVVEVTDPTQDVSPNNILLSVRDPSVWEKVEHAEKEHSVPRKSLSDRTIYLPQQVSLVDGVPVLADFGSSRMGQEKYRGDVMPEVYRAPEVILDMKWDSKIDIWSAGVMIWDLYQGGRLFFARKNGMLDDQQHLAEMVSLMGPPPRNFLERSEKCRKYWDDDGNWIASTPIAEQSFEVREHCLEGEDPRLFVAFARKVLRWLPEERPRADDLMADGFLCQHIRERENENQ